MGPYDLTASDGSGSSSSINSTSTKNTNPEIDGLLAQAGYKVRSSDLHNVAQRLQLLERVMLNNNSNDDNILQIGSDSVHYNPSDLASWVDSMLSELNPPDFITYNHHPTVTEADTWTNHNTYDQNQNQLLFTGGVAEMEEDSGIRLVHLLMTCAETVQRGDVSLAGSLIEDMQTLMTRVNATCGIGKVAGYFIDALSRRLYAPQAGYIPGSALENEILYHNFYEASPYLKFAHFTANQAILEAFEGHDCVHVVDFSLMQGLQWPALIQALALRPGGPPFLQLTGIGPPSPDGRDLLREIGIRLAELAWSVNVRFTFRGVAASCLEDVKPWMLQVNQNEALAVNSIMQLHRVLGSDPGPSPSPNLSRGGLPPIESLLGWIRSLNPKIVTVVEQEANHNQPEFLDRFTEALYYYSTMFDSLEACALQPEKAVAELYIQREICNVVCCEGSTRVERHEPLAKWRERLGQAGFSPLHLGSNAFKQGDGVDMCSPKGIVSRRKKGV
ncbi:hypothetical protein GIB67_005288 [Kingdonia uniflora]|uniref:DELLA protein n=1 Tax=Kingdonia uniflora TaxID=39325 RepID=A0A7J7N643_9MAGN|nr:hypothetical protein GIB67_005288 [Kingdonia uniflora]